MTTSKQIGPEAVAGSAALWKQLVSLLGRIGETSPEELSEQAARALRQALAGEAVDGCRERQLAFRAPDCRVEIRLRQDPEGGTVSFTGSAVDDTGRPLGPERLQLFLCSADVELRSLGVTRRGIFLAREIVRGRQVLEAVVDHRSCHRFAFTV